MKDLMFVCTGNTCRSPMAEGLSKKYLKTWGHINSRGLSASYGQGANLKSIIAMDMEEVNIRGHIAQRFSIEEIVATTVILTMTSGHKDYLLAYYPELKGQVTTLLAYVGLSGQVSDPYGGTQDAYNECAKLIKKAVLRLDDSSNLP